MSSNDGSDQGFKVPQGTWNYRVVKKRGYLAIHEAYYDENGNIFTLSTDPVSPESEDLAQLKTTLELMQEALSDGIIDFEQVHTDHDNP
ncbi:MAG TPA: hypothetical protein VFR78_21650 [Pyrinomonadaceae bacterium]|nr:hypothetical protein [Pyrinomonadaceae bacterium]